MNQKGHEENTSSPLAGIPDEKIREVIESYARQNEFAWSNPDPEMIEGLEKNEAAFLEKSDYEFGDDDFFRYCPKCRTCHDNPIFSIYTTHWGWCHKHKVKWILGENLFSAAKEEDFEEQLRYYIDQGFDDYAAVKDRDVEMDRNGVVRGTRLD